MRLKRRVAGRTTTGYLLLTKGDASFARKGWFAIILAAGFVEENHRLVVHGL